jgi:uncharacterized membrane protein
MCSLWEITCISYLLIHGSGFVPVIASSLVWHYLQTFQANAVHVHIITDDRFLHNLLQFKTVYKFVTRQLSTFRILVGKKWECLNSASDIIFTQWWQTFSSSSACPCLLTNYMTRWLMTKCHVSYFLLLLCPFCVFSGSQLHAYQNCLPRYWLSGSSF